MAKTIFNFHFDYLNPSLSQVSRPTMEQRVSQRSQIRQDWGEVGWSVSETKEIEHCSHEFRFWLQQSICQKYSYMEELKNTSRRNISTTLYLFHQVTVFSSPDTFPLLNSQKPAGSTLYVCLFTYEDLVTLHYMCDGFKLCSCIGTTELSIPTLS